MVLWCRARASEIKYYGYIFQHMWEVYHFAAQKIRRYWTKQCHILNNHHINSHQTHCQTAIYFSHGKSQPQKKMIQNLRRDQKKNWYPQWVQRAAARRSIQGLRPSLGEGDKFWSQEMGVEPKIGGIWPPKWMVKIMENPIEQMDDLGGFPIFLETPILGYVKIN